MPLPFSNSSPSSQPDCTDFIDKSAPGRGSALIVYGLYIGSIIAVVTAPIGVAIAHWRAGRSEPWLNSHFRFQLRTFWLGVLAAMVALALWQLVGVAQLPPIYAWGMGYLFFTVALVWWVGRCAVGVNRLVNNRAIAAPNSWLFGVGAHNNDA